MYCRFWKYDLETFADLLMGVAEMAGTSITPESRRDQVDALYWCLRAHRHFSANRIHEIQQMVRMTAPRTLTVSRQFKRLKQRISESTPGYSVFLLRRFRARSRIMQSVFSAASRRTTSTERLRKEGSRRAENALHYDKSFEPRWRRARLSASVSEPTTPQGGETGRRRQSKTIASPPHSAPSADAAKSAIDGCRPGEKCWRYSRMPAYTQKPPMICTPPRLAP